MVVSFESAVETLNREDDGLVATFVTRAGHYRVRPWPPDLIPTLRGALGSGRVVRVTYDDRTFLIEDAVLA